MKNKGFTLVEILAVIVVLGLIIAIITPTVNNLIKDSEDMLTKEQRNTIINATKKYVVENSDLLPDEYGNETRYIDTNTLIEQGVINENVIINPKTKNEIWGCVAIKYNRDYNQYDYEFIDGCVPIGTQYVFNYINKAQPFTAGANGYYKLEVWGAQGGYRSDSTKGGLGGYASGTIYLEKDDKLYVYVGGEGNKGTCTNSICTGGYNGGGYRYNYKGGGGATDIRLVENENPLDKTSLLSRIIVAGGGGSDGSTDNAGMYGGGNSGGAASSGYGSYGYGGTQTGFTSSLTPFETQPITNSSTNYPGGFGFGGFGIYQSSGYGGAGGGGWYGGTGALPDGSTDDDKGGGGGSGFIWNNENQNNIPEGYSVPIKYYLTDYKLLSGNTSIPTYEGNATTTGNKGNGYAKITFLRNTK